MENHNWLIGDVELFQASGTVGRRSSGLLEQIPKPVTVGGDKRFDPLGLVAECRHLPVTPHKTTRRQRVSKVHWISTLGCVAYKLMRMRNPGRPSSSAVTQRRRVSSGASS